MSAHERGLYEELITEALAQRLDSLPRGLVAVRRQLRSADAADRLALHLARLIERIVSDMPDRERVERGLALTRQLVDLLADAVPGHFEIGAETPVGHEPVLRAIAAIQPDGSQETIDEPLIPLLDTTLLTNSPGEPGVGQQILTEIGSADRIDLVMAFIRRTGIRPLRDAIRQHCERGREIRVLTTTYTGATELAALQELADLGANVQVSYDESTTRLHAKAWLFHRGGGIQTAYVGSSNLSHSAQVSGLEWNVRVSGVRNPDLVAKIAAVFESYWRSGDFVPFDAFEFTQRTNRDHLALVPALSPVEIRLEPFQERLLEEVAVAREQGRHRNLLASATGTGKTVMAAVDYTRLRDELPRSRLLFIAHRQELLEQARMTYAQALQEPAFGELWVGGQRPERWEHVFASIQSLSARDLGNLEPDHFDVVVIDEFHHAAAPTYKALLDHVRPCEMLGLTATPERADGLPVLHWFGDTITAELRLWDAIDQGRLVPFEYYGLHDGIDLRDVPWRRGRGYDVATLANVYTGNDAWARVVRKQFLTYIADPADVRALGFCVNVEHARFMARVFEDAGIAATAIWGDSPEDERRSALDRLRSGEISVLFSVDLFNEGVDLPKVDTLLLLRPTDSPTLFLQQLGRGLRKHRNKAACLVLDFVGLHRREFRFDRRLGALLGGSRRHIQRQVEDGFPFLPAGCHMQLDHKARGIVLDSIRKAVPSRWREKAEELGRLSREGRGSLADFLDDSGLSLDDIYTGTHCWSDLRETAGLDIAEPGPFEDALRRACGRQLHVDDRERMEAYRTFLESPEPPVVTDPDSRRSRLIRMLIASVCDQVLEREATLASGIDLLWKHPQVRAELVELYGVLRDRIDHMHYDLSAPHNAIPLRIHGRYTRTEILAAFTAGPDAKVAEWREGVRWIEEVQADLFAFTLDKTTGGFSPTTRYRDYAISPDLIHWESQSTLRADSPTGQRYQHHSERGTAVMLFARESVANRAFWFLGPATYVGHEGERPMAITWRLHHRMPGDLYSTFAAAVA